MFPHVLQVTTSTHQLNGSQLSNIWLDSTGWPGETSCRLPFQKTLGRELIHRCLTSLRLLAFVSFSGGGRSLFATGTGRFDAHTALCGPGGHEHSVLNVEHPGVRQHEPQNSEDGSSRIVRDDILREVDAAHFFCRSQTMDILELLSQWISFCPLSAKSGFPGCRPRTSTQSWRCSESSSIRNGICGAIKGCASQQRINHGTEGTRYYFLNRQRS